MLSEDDEKKAIAVIDWTDELKKTAFERSIKDEKGEEIPTLNKEKSSTFKILADSRAEKVFKEVEREFKEHEDKILKQSPSKRSGSWFETLESAEEELFAKKCENLLLQSHI